MDWFHIEQESNRGCSAAAQVDRNQINAAFVNTGLQLFLCLNAVHIGGAMVPWIY